MKRNILSLFVLAALSLTSCKKEASVDEAEAATVASDAAVVYTVDTATSVIEWKGEKPGGAHTGTISLAGGTVSVANGAVESGKFTIDMKSITVTDLKAGDGKEDLEAHLKGTGEKEKEDHFFNTAKHPEATFEITKVADADGKTNVEGNLTLKGITKNVKFPATVSVDGATVSISSEGFMIDRTQWGVNYASKSIFDNLKDKFVNDEIELKINVKATK